MSIVRRTVYYEKLDGQPFRFSDWSKVTTTDVGACVEPTCFAHRGFQDPSTTWAYDPTDEITRVDLLKNMDMSAESNIMSGYDANSFPLVNGENGIIHGGTMYPREGK